MSRGIYGQAEGHESRAVGNGGAMSIRDEALELAERLDRNELGMIRGAWLNRNGGKLDAIYTELRAMGYDYRNAMGLITRATLGKVAGNQKFVGV